MALTSLRRWKSAPFSMQATFFTQPAIDDTHVGWYVGPTFFTRIQAKHNLIREDRFSVSIYTADGHDHILDEAHVELRYLFSGGWHRIREVKLPILVRLDRS